MPRPAHVRSLAALGEFRADLLAFVAEGREALSANEMELQRAFSWLDSQTQFWAREIRARYEVVVRTTRDPASAARLTCKAVRDNPVPEHTLERIARG